MRDSCRSMRALLHAAGSGVAEHLKRAGCRIIPVNPVQNEVLGEKCYEDVPEQIDLVDIFRRSEFVPEIVESAIRVGARAVWMQGAWSTRRLWHWRVRWVSMWSWTGAL